MELGIVIATEGSTAGRYITTSHPGQPTLEWSVPSRIWTAAPDRSQMKNNAIYDQINRYLASLPEEKQLAIYNIYAEEFKFMNSIGGTVDQNIEFIISRIRDLMAKLYSHIEEQHFYNWVWGSLVPTIPPEIKQFFEPGMPGTRERTYLVNDYRGLIPLLLAVRFATPVCMQFMVLAEETLPENHRDTFTYSLLSKTWISKCEAMKRLHSFTDKTIGNDRYQEVAIHEGISSEDYVYWTLASMMIRKAPVIDVTGSVGAASVPSVLWKFIDNKPDSLASSGPKIRFKENPSDSGDGDNNASVLEGYRTRQQQSTGQRMLNPFYLQRHITMLENGIIEPMSMIARVCPDFDVELYKDALSSTSSLMNVSLTEEQTTLASWVFDPYLSARSIGNIRKAEVIKLLAMAQTVLLQQGRFWLATLVTANYSLPPTGMFFANNSLINPSIARYEEFYKLFPMQKESRSSVRAATNSVIVKAHNYAQTTIADIVAGIERYVATRTISDAAIDRFAPEGISRRFIQIPYPKDLKLQIMEFAEHLATRPQVKIDPNEIYTKLTGLPVLSEANW